MRKRLSYSFLRKWLVINRFISLKGLNLTLLVIFSSSTSLVDRVKSLQIRLTLLRTVQKWMQAALQMQEKARGWVKIGFINTTTLPLQLLLKKGVLIWVLGQADRAILVFILGEHWVRRRFFTNAYKSLRQMKMLTV